MKKALNSIQEDLSIFYLLFNHLNFTDQQHSCQLTIIIYEYLYPYNDYCCYYHHYESLYHHYYYRYVKLLSLLLTFKTSNDH